MSRPALYDPGLRDLLRRAAEAYRRHDDPVFRAHMEEAAARAPQRVDLRLCLANHHIQTGLAERALELFGELAWAVPRDVDVLAYLAHWRRHAGDAEGAERARGRLAAIRPGRAADLLQIWRRIDAWTLFKPSDRIPDLPPEAKRRAIVAPGYILAPDGTPRADLLERLEKTLEAAERFPGACVIVSGGVPRAGVAEAAVMGEWLRARGVAAERVHEEGYSRDLVENVVYSRHILDLLGVEAALIVNSAENIRRTGAAFETHALACGSAWSVQTVCASGASFRRFADDGSDRLKLYRDALRAHGMPMMAAYPELAER